MQKKGSSNIKFILTAIVVLSLGVLTAVFFYASEIYNQNKEQEELNKILDEPTEATIEIPSDEYAYYVNMLETMNGIEVPELEYDQATVKKGNHTLNLVRVLPKVDVRAIEQTIKKHLGENESLYGIYVYDFKRDIEISHRADEIRPPASISKVPVAMLILKEAEKGNLSLDSKLTVPSSYAYTIFSNVLGTPHAGKELAIRDLLHWMIVDSDNISVRMLEDVLGGAPGVVNLTKTELGVDPFFRDPHDTTARNVGTIFRQIYDQSYLDKEMNDFLLYLLLNTAPTLQEELPPGLPKGTEIAHKTGRIWMDLGGVAWEDAGIVYGETTDYVIVYLNQYVTPESGQRNAQEISKIVYDALN